MGTSGYTVQDTATGKIYEWVTATFIKKDGKPLNVESITIKDPVNNKMVLKTPKKDKNLKKINNYFSSKEENKKVKE